MILDGSTGGGQILRTALALSAITSKEFTIKNIRGARATPGLQAQHLKCVEAVRDICGAKVEGARLNSTTLTFKPGKLKEKTLSIDIGTAGSATLILQCLLPISLFVKKARFRIKGGTDVKWSMSLDYFREVILPIYDRYAKINFTLVHRGYFPKGAGLVDIEIRSRIHKKAEPIILLEQGELEAIEGLSHCSEDLVQFNIAEKMSKGAMQVLTKPIEGEIKIKSEHTRTMSSGAVITLWATFQNTIIGADGLLTRGKSPDILGNDTAHKLLDAMEYCADEHLADNLIPLLGLFGGSIQTGKITDHIKTNIDVCTKFLQKQYKVEGHVISSD